jgi:hypothetical protein
VTSPAAAASNRPAATAIVAAQLRVYPKTTVAGGGVARAALR